MKKSFFPVFAPAPLLLALIINTCGGTTAFAGPNDFFGSSIPGNGSGADSPSSAASASVGSATANPSELAPPASAGAQDYTTDEKRMQKRYRDMLKHMELLVARGDKMMKDGERHKNDKLFKKGKVLKAIGEKQLADFKANSPLPEDKQKAEKN